MTERSSTEYNSPNKYPSLNDKQFRINKISDIREYFVGQIKERELLSKIFNKYIASFDYFYKSLIVLSVTTGSSSIASFPSVIGAPVEISSASFFQFL